MAASILKITMSTTAEDALQIHPRDILARDTFTPAETLLFITILLVTVVLTWAADPRSFWILGFAIILGGFCPIILKTHESTHPFFLDLLWPKFWLLTTPVWLLIIQFCIGLGQQPLSEVKTPDGTFLTLKTVSSWLPTSAITPTTWINLLGFCGIYMLVINVFLVPKSRAFFERLLPWLCLNAALIALWGYFQKALGLKAPLLTKGTGSADFFAFYPYDGHWAAFALIWATVCSAMALLELRYLKESERFIDSIGAWYLTGAALLGASGFAIQARMPSTILLFGFAGLMLLVASTFLAKTKDPQRRAIVFTCGLGGMVTFAGGLYRLFQTDPYATKAQALREASAQMFTDKPLFGWGIESFSQIIPFYADDRLLGGRYTRAGSDMLQYLAELGIIGFLIAGSVMIILLIRYIRGRHNINLTNHLLIGCLGIIVMAFFDTPFMSPAVFYSYTLVFLIAFRWADLTRNKVDEVDARPALVMPAGERRVPFFKGKYEESHK
ncbi:MAG: O-antigen ligase family protein [Verrucomicrobiota bacterium]